MLFQLVIDVPQGVVATVELPNGRIIDDVAAGTHSFECGFRAAENDPPRPRQQWRGGPAEEKEKELTASLGAFPNG